MIELDKTLFHLINTEWACEFLDWLMPLVTNQEAGIFVLLGIILAIGILGGRKGRMTAIACVISAAIIDFVGSNFLKEIIARPRPCHLEMGRLLVDCGSGYAMPSLHAANSFGVFTPIVWQYKWKAAPLYLIAIAVSYSRIYVGVHWPADTIGGLIWGIIVGTLVSWIFYKSVFGKNKKAESNSTEK